MERTILSEAGLRRQVWLGVLIIASMALTTRFACITPFVAFGVIAATTLSRRDALFLTIAAWVANQTVGFALLHYPWMTNSLAWGIAIGAAAVIATVTSQQVAGRLHVRSLIQALAGFAAAFVIYELVLYTVAVAILGGASAFAPRVVGQVLLVNTVALIVLYGLNQFAIAAGLLGSRHRSFPTPSVPFA